MSKRSLLGERILSNLPQSPDQDETLDDANALNNSTTLTTTTTTTTATTTTPTSSATVRGASNPTKVSRKSLHPGHGISEDRQTYINIMGAMINSRGRTQRHLKRFRKERESVRSFFTSTLDKTDQPWIRVEIPAQDEDEAPCVRYIRKCVKTSRRNLDDKAISEAISQNSTTIHEMINAGQREELAEYIYDLLKERALQRKDEISITSRRGTLPVDGKEKLVESIPEGTDPDVLIKCVQNYLAIQEKIKEESRKSKEKMTAYREKALQHEEAVLQDMKSCAARGEDYESSVIVHVPKTKADGSIENTSKDYRLVLCSRKQTRIPTTTQLKDICERVVDRCLQESFDLEGFLQALIQEHEQVKQQNTKLVEKPELRARNRKKNKSQ